MRSRIVLASLALAVALPGMSGVAAAHPPGPNIGGSSAATQTTHGFEQIGHVNPGVGTNGDLFVHRGTAYLASWVGKGCLSKGVRAYDLRNPRQPRYLSTFADAKSDPSVKGSWTEKIIIQRVITKHFIGDLAVVTFQRCGEPENGFRGFGLYDVTRPSKPRKLAMYSAPNTNGSHEVWLGARLGRAYVYTAIIDSEITTGEGYDPETGDAKKPGRADFRIVDVSRPTRPRDVGEWGAWKQLGVKPIGETTSNFVHSVRVDDRLQRAYLSYWDLGTIILDVRNPARPKLIGKTTPDQGNAHSTAVGKNGRLLIETHETSGGLAHIYNISNPARPYRVSKFSIPGADQTTVHDPEVRGNTVFFSWYNFGIVAADLRDPTALRKTAQFIPQTSYVNPDYFCARPCPDVWGVELYGDLIVAADMNSGLYVLKYRPGFGTAPLQIKQAGLAPTGPAAVLLMVLMSITLAFRMRRKA